MAVEAALLGVRLRRTLHVATVGVEPVRIVDHDPRVVACCLYLSSSSPSTLIAGGSYTEVQNQEPRLTSLDNAYWFYGVGELWIASVHDSASTAIVLVQVLYRE